MYRPLRGSDSFTHLGRSGLCRCARVGTPPTECRNRSRGPPSSPFPSRSRSCRIPARPNRNVGRRKRISTQSARTAQGQAPASTSSTSSKQQQAAAASVSKHYCIAAASGPSNHRSSFREIQTEPPTQSQAGRQVGRQERGSSAGGKPRR